MDLELDGQVALISGASRGIGAATAHLLAREGAHVVVGYHRNRAGAEQTAELVREAGRTAWLCPMDVTDATTVEAAVAALPDAAHRLNVLILCAGEAPSLPLDQLSPAEWKRVVDVNLNGAFNLMSVAQPWLVDGASIVTVASVAGQTGVPLQAHYAAAKAGLINLTKSAARAWAPNIRVNCVAPGMTLTEMGQRTAANLPTDYAQQKLLLQRFAQPEEIAKCIAFLASPAAGFITGATLDANGGRNLR
jgi:3-oxoacyl-[acyl-carrier protein] reductase